MKTEEKAPPVTRLNYVEGDLIIKEGDFGISIYEIISGKIGIFVDSEGTEVKVATLGPGMIVGEMSFLSSNTTPRSASARALEDSCLEAWHPAMLSNAYKQMPDILKRITGQALKRLVRVNKMVSGLTLNKETTPPGQAQEPSKIWKEKRSSYRKEVSLNCTYRPAKSAEGFKLNGRIENISRGGVLMVVNRTNLTSCPHVIGDQFVINTAFSPGQEVEMIAKIASQREGNTAATIAFGMAFTDMTSGDQKKLGFFLMP
jgi:hypothetical protein